MTLALSSPKLHSDLGNLHSRAARGESIAFGFDLLRVFAKRVDEPLDAVALKGFGDVVLVDVRRGKVCEDLVGSARSRGSIVAG